MTLKTLAKAENAETSNTPTWTDLPQTSSQSISQNGLTAATASWAPGPLPTARINCGRRARIQGTRQSRAAMGCDSSVNSFGLLGRYNDMTN